MMQEAYRSKACNFITVTYGDNYIPVTKDGFKTLNKEHFKDFIRLLRTRIDRSDYGKNEIRYYACGEYGPKTFRPHYHSIIYNLPDKYRDTGLRDISIELSNLWDKGVVTCSEGVSERMQYTAKYIQKKVRDRNIIDYETGEVYHDNREIEFSLMSKGLGKDFMTEKMQQWMINNKETSVDIKGYKLPIPRYYRKKASVEFKEMYQREISKFINDDDYQLRKIQILNNNHKHSKDGTEQL